MHWHALLSGLFGAGTWGTGGNLIAAVILGIPSAIAAYFGRHKITARLAALWAIHHGPHAIEQHKQAMRELEAEKAMRKDGSSD